MATLGFRGLSRPLTSGQQPSPISTDAKCPKPVNDCAAAVREVVDESGDRLLHRDLHD